MSAVRGSIGPMGRQMELGVVTVAVVSGAGSASVTFRDPFLRPPEVLVPAYEADAGTVAAASITKNGFTVTLTGSDFGDGDLRLAYVALAKG